MKIRLAIILAISVLCVSVYSQKSTAEKASDYDAALAHRVGADERGMKNFVFCILKTGPNDAKITDAKDREKIFAGHMANIKRLGEEGKLLLAGPFGNNDRSYRGLFIFNVTTVEEARKLVETDPVIKSGMMIAELTPWYGSAATMLIPENHKKLVKTPFK